jgi:regulator of replication initiation timing
MNIQFFDILPYIVSLVTAAGGWFAGKRKHNNDFLQDMQKSIDMLTAKNAELVKQVLGLNGEVIKLRKENAELRVEVESLNKKLSNVKTITRKI